MARGQGSKPKRGATGDQRAASTNVAGTDHWDKGLEPSAQPARADARGRRPAATAGNEPTGKQPGETTSTSVAP